jgi:protein ImuB
MSGRARQTARVMVVSCPDVDAEGFGRLVALVNGYCPRVESVRLGVCAFGARGPARYFGGEEALASLLIAATESAGFACRIGVADGLFAALLAAGTAAAADASGPAAAPDASDTAADAGDTAGAFVTVVPAGGTAGFLAGQPVSVLDDAELAGLLARLGIRTLGDLAALPAESVASRFGEAGETAHRLARGEQRRPLAVSAPPADLAVGVEFDPPHELAEPVVFAAKGLAERFHAGLAARGVTCVRVEVEVTWADGRRTSRLWRHDGLLTAVQVADRVRWGLEPGAGDAAITVLRLVPDQLVRAAGRQLALWGEEVVAGKVARAAMRVQALLGHDAVLRPVRSGGRTVRDQLQPVPFGENLAPKRATDQPWPGRIPGPPPAVVYPEPKPARVTDAAGGPVTVSGRCVMSGIPAELSLDGEPELSVTGWAGPWPLAERWWDPESATREARFQLVTDDGRAWLAAVRASAWQIEAGYW